MGWCRKRALLKQKEPYEIALLKRKEPYEIALLQQKEPYKIALPTPRVDKLFVSGGQLLAYVDVDHLYFGFSTSRLPAVGNAWHITSEMDRDVLFSTLKYLFSSSRLPAVGSAWHITSSSSTKMTRAKVQHLPMPQPSMRSGEVGL